MKFLERLFRRRYSMTMWAAAHDHLEPPYHIWAHPIRPVRDDGIGWYSDAPDGWYVTDLRPFANIVPALINLRPEDEPIRIKLTLEVLD